LLFLLAMGLVLIVVAALLAYQAIAEAGAFAVHPYLYLGLLSGAIGLGLVGLFAVRWCTRRRAP